MTEQQQTDLKTKIRNICLNYTKIHIKYQSRQLICNLSRNEDLTVLKQDKGQGVVLMDRLKYIEKCHDIVDKEQFIRLEEDPLRKIEGSTQRLLII